MPGGVTSAEATGGPPARRESADLVETACFDSAGRFVFRADPKGPPIGTIVFASSLFAELQRNYRREVLLARAAASAGFSTLRFHYRGVGNSVGPPVTPTLDTMTADIVEVMAPAGQGPVAIVGTRLGALAAARARAHHDVPLVLWEPVLDGRRWVEEVIRACLAREVARGGDVTAETIRRRWDTEGVVFALGETVPAEVADQVAATDLIGSISGSAPVQVVQMGRSTRVRPGTQRALDALAERGIEAEVLPVVGHQVWWLKAGGDRFDPVEREDATRGVNEGVLDWVKRTIT